MPQPNQVKQVAVLGAGTIGASRTALFLARGLRVAVQAPNPAAEAYVRGYVADAWPSLQRLGMADDAAPDRWTFHASPGPAGGGTVPPPGQAPTVVTQVRNEFGGSRRTYSSHFNEFAGPRAPRPASTPPATGVDTVWLKATWR